MRLPCLESGHFYFGLTYFFEGLTILTNTVIAIKTIPIPDQIAYAIPKGIVFNTSEKK